MGSDEQRSRDLDELKTLIRELAAILEDEGGGAGKKKQKKQARSTPGCSIKSLPSSLKIAAAETAVNYNPANAPHTASLASLGVGSAMISPLAIAVMTTKYWGPSQRRLTVSFLEPTPKQLRNLIVQHLNAWNEKAGISFAYVSSGGNVRITREDSGYWSYVGTDILHIDANSPTMCLEAFSVNTAPSEYKRVVRHEAGHTLGFPHEHMRKELVERLDPAKCYEYFGRTQGWTRQDVDAQVLTPLNRRSIFGTAPDQLSIMCYQLPGEITKDGRPILGGLDINRTDAEFAAKIYPKFDGRHAFQAEHHEEELLSDGSEIDDGEEFDLSEQVPAGFTLQPLEI